MVGTSWFLWFCEIKHTHSFEGAVTGQPVGVQRFGTVLTRWEQLVQQVTDVLVVTAAQLLHAGDLHPETGHLLLQGHVQLKKKRTTSGLLATACWLMACRLCAHSEGSAQRHRCGSGRGGGQFSWDGDRVRRHSQVLQNGRSIRLAAVLPVETQDLSTERRASSPHIQINTPTSSLTDRF